MHGEFLDALNGLGIANATPKSILQQMEGRGLSRENVASHLQKYRCAHRAGRLARWRLTAPPLAMQSCCLHGTLRLQLHSDMPSY